ncbi:MAG TPA: S-layer homology domain-containing protein [Thermoanaerobaculia bacterium]|nr:S-layer homology domain-containing protein [Thermoanaerobaculia bacterium]
MKLRTLPSLSFAILLVLALHPAGAATIVPPANLGELARMSRAVVLAEAVESWGEDGATVPVTVTRFNLLQAVSGAATGDVFEVQEPGGRGKTRAAVVDGAARFTAGHRYLLFLDVAPGARWRPRMMAFGLLEETSEGVLRPTAEAREIAPLPTVPPAEPVAAYRETALLQHLREVVAGAPWDRDKVVLGTAEPSLPETSALGNSPSYCVYMTDPGDGLPLRWFGFETGTTASIVATTPGQNGLADGGTAAIQQGVAAWTNDPNSVIRYNYGGTRARNITCSANFDVDQGAAVFNDPCNDIADLAGCTGTLAFGGSFYNLSAQPYDGLSWHQLTTPFVVVNNGAECIGATGFKEALTHELGHSLGFGHHTPPNRADTTMSAILNNDGRGATIEIVDKQCAAFDYHTFLDVPYRYWAWRWIEAVENAGVTPTPACGSGNYCPANPMTRDEMAIFLLRAKEGGSYTPPACTTPMFSDVPCSNSYAPWINELVRRGITAGCGGGNYCPTTSVTRAQMAVFLLVTLGISPPACTTPAFADVPCSSPFAPFIDELVRRGVTAGCGSGDYCPNSAVNRDQMAVFLATNFSLPLAPAPPAN